MSANAKHTPVVDIHGQALDAPRIAYRCDVDKETAFVMAEAPALLAALKIAAEKLEEAQQEFYYSAHSSGDPADEKMTSSDAIAYRECRDAAVDARAVIARAEGGKP